MNGRHDIRLVKRQVQALPTDWARDTSNPTESTDEEITRQWQDLTTYKLTEAAEQWEKRYPSPPIALISPDPSLPGECHSDETSQPPSDAFRALTGISDIPKHSRQSDTADTVSEDSSDSTERQSEESEMSSRDKAYKEHLLGRVRHQLRLNQFDPSFIKLEIDPDQRKEGNELLERGKTVYQSEEGIQLRREIANFNKKPDQAMEQNEQREKGDGIVTSQAEAMTMREKEQALAKLQARLLNIVSHAMVGDSYADLHHETGDHHMDHSRMLHANKFPRIRGDITTLKKGREILGQSSETARETCANGASKIDWKQDKQRGNFDDLACYSVGWDVVKVQTFVADQTYFCLGCQLVCVRENPMAGDVYGFTACGPIFRLWCYDPLGYASSLPCDISPDGVSSDHMDDFLLMVALLCGPLDVLLSQWSPSSESIMMIRDDPDDSGSPLRQITDWKPSKDTKDVRHDGVVFVREQLTGRRSTAFAGKGTIDGKEKDLVIKLSYLPERSRHHEQRVTRHLRDFDFDGLLERGQAGTADLKFEEGDVADLRRGYSRLPHYVGTLDFDSYAAKTITHDNPRTGRRETLYLSGLVTEGRSGEVLPYDAPLKQTVDVYADALCCMWASTLCNVYYRDPNQGNILLHPAGGGMLIDYGNALIMTDLPDTPTDEDELADAARSANEYFICLAAIEAGELAARLRARRKAYDSAVETRKTAMKALEAYTDALIDTNAAPDAGDLPDTGDPLDIDDALDTGHPFDKGVSPDHDDSRDANYPLEADGPLDTDDSLDLDDSRDANYSLEADGPLDTDDSFVVDDESELAQLFRDAAVDTVNSKKKYLEDVEQAIATFCEPRFFDDVESLVYCLAHQLGRRDVRPDPKNMQTAKINPAAQLLEQNWKSACLKENLVPLLEKLNLSEYSQRRLEEAAKAVKLTGQSFLKEHPCVNSVQPNPKARTSVDSQCFGATLKPIRAMRQPPPIDISSALRTAARSPSKRRKANPNDDAVEQPVPKRPKLKPGKA